MKQFGVIRPELVVKIGDTAADMKEGKNAGAWSVGVVIGSSAANLTEEMAAALSDAEREARFAHAEEVLKNAGADYVIRTMRELPDVIRAINERMN